MAVSFVIWLTVLVKFTVGHEHFQHIYFFSLVKACKIHYKFPNIYLPCIQNHSSGWSVLQFCFTLNTRLLTPGPSKFLEGQTITLEDGSTAVIQAVTGIGLGISDNLKKNSAAHFWS